MPLHEEVRSGREVCEGGGRHVQRDSGEVWSRSDTWVQSGSALSPILLAVMMDRLTNEVRQELL